MGKIIETGLKIVCDRCDKPKDVVDEKQVAFYKEFSKKKERDDTMFAFVLNGFDGAKNASFEYLCPDCLSAIVGYVGKCEKPAGRKGKDDDKKDPPPPETKTDAPKTTEAPKTEAPKTEPPKTEAAAAPPKEEKPTADPATDDDDIFDS